MYTHHTLKIRVKATVCAGLYSKSVNCCCDVFDHSNRPIGHRKWAVLWTSAGILPQVGDMGSIVFPAARALVAWLEKHGGNLEGVRALGRSFFVFDRSGSVHWGDNSMIFNRTWERIGSCGSCSLCSRRRCHSHWCRRLHWHAEVI